MVAWNRFAKLLQGPGRHWMCGDVAMHDAPCSDLHQEEHIESSEPGGHYDQEIAGDDGLGVNPQTDSRFTGSPIVAVVCVHTIRGPGRDWNANDIMRRYAGVAFCRLVRKRSVR